MDWLILRGVERLLIVVVGGLCVFLGYRLFIKGVSGEASLRVEHDKSKLQLVNAAPGVFFALAGVTILVAMTWKTVSGEATLPMRGQTRADVATGVPETAVRIHMHNGQRGSAEEPPGMLHVRGSNMMLGACCL